MDRRPDDPNKGDIPWEELWQKISGKKQEAEQWSPNKKSPVIWIVIAVVIVGWFLTGIYTVGPGEEGVVKRFGEHVSTKGPGLNYHFPSPIESVNRVNMEEIQIAEIGFRTLSNSQFQMVKAESQMLTEDENIVDAQMVVQFKVRDSADFLFNVDDVKQVLHDATEVALRDAVGNSTIDAVMIEERTAVQNSAMEFLQRLLDDYGSGLQITTVKLQYAGPPDEVKDAFDEVVRAREDKDKVVREAEGYAADVVPRARGESEKILLAATAYKEQRVLQAEGDSAKFLKILREHEIPAAFKVLAEDGVGDALDVIIQIGTIEEGSADAELLTALTRDRLYEIMSRLGATGGASQAGELTAQKLVLAFQQMELTDEYEVAYQEAIQLTEERLYLETMEDVLSGTEKFVIDPDNGDSLMPFLPLKEIAGGNKTQEVVQ